MSERVSIPIILVVWLLITSLALAAWGVRSLLNGTLSGFVGSLPGVMLLGTKLSQSPTAAGVSAGPVPNAALIALGFVVLGVFIGSLAGLVARAVPRRRVDGSTQAWLFRFGVVACCCVAPLLFVGGLVTSTNSGMAVEDWPNTFGSNMFLYPLGPRAASGVYLEHAHRLFGTLVGLATLVLMSMVWRHESRKWVCWLITIAFVLVVAQGVLGGVRVRMGSVDPASDKRVYAMLHGVLAQLLFGLLVAGTVFLSPMYKGISSTTLDPSFARRMKFFTTALMHSLILQLLLGAAYRHFRHMHILWTHIAFALLVTVVGIVGGLIVAQASESEGRSRFRHLGTSLILVVVIQFCLGWGAFLMGGRGLQADGIGEALVRTTHQANGALLLALATAGFVWGRRLARVSAADSQKLA